MGPGTRRNPLPLHLQDFSKPRSRVCSLTHPSKGQGIENQPSLFDMNPVQRPPRPRDLIWDEMERLFGAVPHGSNAHARRNKAIKDLKLMSARIEELARAHTAFQDAFPRALCTDIALATHFPLLRPKKIQPPCPECGIGGNMHTIDCPCVT